MLSRYPITPRLPWLKELFNGFQLRDTEDGKATCAVVQAEDELAAAGMVVGG